MLIGELAKKMLWVTQHHHVSWLALRPHCLLVQTMAHNPETPPSNQYVHMIQRIQHDRANASNI